MATLTTKTGRKINIKPKSKTTTSPLAVDDSYMNSTQWVWSTGWQNTNTTVDMESQWDEILSPVKWDVNYWQSFNYNTGTFANWNKPKWIAPTISKISSPNTIAWPSTVSWPSTASNLTKPQSTVMVWGVKKSKYLPETLELRQADPIWVDKKEETPPSFDFNTQLSSLYWKWLTDKSAIFSELSKDKSFASLDNIKQQEYITKMSENIREMNAAKEKADMTNEQFDPAEYARQKWFEIQTWDVKEIQKWWKEITDNLKYQGSIYDNNAEDMQFKKEQTIRQLEQNMEQTKIQVNRQIEDVAKQAQQTIDMGEKVGALKGYNKSGWYVQWLMNIQQESMKTIQRLQQDLARAEMLTGEDKALAMQEYDKNMTRAKEEFDYKMRSVVAEWQTELSKMVMWKYDPKKLWEMLDELSYDVIKKRMDIESQYINNIKGANDIITQQFDQYKAMDDYTDNQRKEFTSILNANDWEALASMSAKDIERFVSQGYLSQEQWVAYYQSMVSKTIGALSEYGIPTQNDIDTVISSIKNGLSPLQSVAWVVQNNPNRYSSVKDDFMSVWKDSNVFNKKTGEFVTAPWATGWVMQQQTPTATLQTIQSVLPKYVNVKDWTKVGKWQCWEFVNDYIRETTGINYNMFVDPIDTRMLKANSDIPTVWSVVIIDRKADPKASPLAQIYGHVGIVFQVNPNGTFNYKDQNGKNKLSIGTANNVSVSNNMRFFDPQLWLSQWDWWKSSWVWDRYNNTLYSTILWSKKTWPQQETFKEWLSWLQWDDEATQRYLEQQYVDTLPTDTKKTLEMFDSTSSQAESALDILYWAKVQGRELNNSIRSKIWRNVDDITAFFWWWLEDSTKKYRQLRASIDASQADYRNALFGASLTPWEKASADTFIVDKNDTIDTVIAKLEWQKKTSNIMRSNLIKKKLWLPVEKIINPFNTENKELVATTKTTQTKPLQTTQPTVKTNTGKRDVTKELNAMFWL